MTDPKIGEIFEERFFILDELGSGGMGKVFRAKQLDANREVALKILRHDRIWDKNSVQRFFREFRTLSQLRHPHIMTVYGLAMDSESSPYAICEYIEGKNLAVLLEENEYLTWERATGLVLQIADALQYSHKQGVLHRDVKPENLMLCSFAEDFVKIIDFGLAKQLTRESPAQQGDSHVSNYLANDLRDSQSGKLTLSGQFLGSPLYASPEQSSYKTDERSDIYILGSVFFELLSGEKLFPGESAAESLARHRSEDPTPRFKVIASRVPYRILEILSKMLAKNPQERFSNMEEFSTSLKEVLKDPETLTVSRFYLDQRRVKRDSAAIIPLTLFAALFLVVLLAAKSISNQPLRAASVSSSPEIALLKMLENQDTTTSETTNKVSQDSESKITELTKLIPTIQRKSSLYVAYDYRATAEYSRGNIPGAIRDYEKCLELSRRKDKAFTLEAARPLTMMAYLQLINNPKKSKELAEKALEVADYNKRNLIQLRLPSFAKIPPARCYEAASHHILAYLAFEQKDFAQAIKLAEQASQDQLDETHSTIFGCPIFIKINALYAQGKKQEALDETAKSVAEVDQIVESRPNGHLKMDRFKLLSVAAQFYDEIGEKERAEELLNILKNADGNHKSYAKFLLEARSKSKRSSLIDFPT
ncbi:MAG: protein kinase [Candidatus Obscuribacterales bacterium]|nr:protein kinase [Candidatus Obscuribacterales bacterium]